MSRGVELPAAQPPGRAEGAEGEVRSRGQRLPRSCLQNESPAEIPDTEAEWSSLAGGQSLDVSQGDRL